jgi:ribonucleoside-diphosphate reductase alpha chain
MTVYRKGCRDGVLVDATPTKKALTKTDAPQRPAELPCEIHHVSVKKQPFVVAVGLFGSEPYEVFGFENTRRLVSNNDGLLLEKKHRQGIIRKVKRGLYELWSEDSEENLLPDCDSLSFCLADDQEALTRMISTALRHGADVSFVVHQLEKVKGDLTSFAKAVARAMKKYVKDGTTISGETCGSCGAESLVRQEGCCTCNSCGWSKCS